MIKAPSLTKIQLHRYQRIYRPCLAWYLLSSPSSSCSAPPPATSCMKSVSLVQNSVLVSGKSGTLSSKRVAMRGFCRLGLALNYRSSIIGNDWNITSKRQFWTGQEQKVVSACRTIVLSLSLYSLPFLCWLVTSCDCCMPSSCLM